MEKSEKYLGGFSSPYLRRGAVAGYGIYTTDKRIFGVYNRIFSLSFYLSPRAPRKFYGRDLQYALAKKGGQGIIRELERKRNFEAKKEDVMEIELKRPGWSRGHIIIRLINGSKIRIWITNEQDSELARELFNKFSPSTLSVI